MSMRRKTITLTEQQDESQMLVVRVLHEDMDAPERLLE
jgi:plasmid stabilization system protein ParE